MKWCRNGLHLMTESNIRRTWSGRDQVYREYCKACRNKSDREWKAEKRAGNTAPRPRSYSRPPETKEWMLDARCGPASLQGDEDAEWFFEPMHYPKAAELCAECPVRLECLETNLYEPFGFSGGMNPQQRMQLLRNRGRAKGAARYYAPPMPKQSRFRNTDEGYQITDLDRAEVLRVYNEGNGIRRTSDQTGLSRSCVQRIVKKYGQIRSEQEQLRLARVNHSATLREKRQAANDSIRKLLLERPKYSVKEIAELVDMSDTTVYTVRREMVKEGLLDPL